MYLTEFMNQHKDDWQTILAAAPYYITIRNTVMDDISYYILSYDMIQSDFSSPLVCEARGSIFRFDPFEDKWICVCHPFDKFFNYGERYSAVNKIDWSTASVQQKVDGSLAKIWYDLGKWYVSTNGTIDAFSAKCGGSHTYGDLVKYCTDHIPNFWEHLDTNYCYMFELTSPFNHIVIQYSGIKLWYLGRRNMQTEEETMKPLYLEGLFYPERFSHHSLAECVEAAHQMGVNEEGYVVCDSQFNRIKIKGDEYLRLHKMRGNGILSLNRVIEMWQDDTLDDFLAYYPEYNDFVKSIMVEVTHMIQQADLAYKTIMSYSTNYLRAEFAAQVNQYDMRLRPFLFARFDNKYSNAKEFYKSLRASTVANYIKNYIKIHTIGVMEDNG